MAEITETVPFNFSELYNGIKTKFEDAGYDTEEGSNTSQLITAMAYLTSMLNVNTAVNINETILPLATRRDNVLQDARALGYEVQHKLSYRYKLTLQFTAGNHTIPKYSLFTIGGKSYYYMGKQLELINVPAGKEIEIIVTEGTLYKYSDYTDVLTVTTTSTVDATGSTIPQYYIDIPYIDVEDSGIEVYVTYYDVYGNLVTREQWLRSKHFMIDADTTLNKQFIRLDTIDYKTPRIYFTLAGVGEGLRVGSIVEMNILTTTGVDGIIDDLTDTAGVIHEIDSATVTLIELVAEGTDEEDITSIKENAPKFYNSANRAVTKTDYEAICNRQTTVNTTLVWGGDDELPKCPGHIWFSFFPSRYNRSFSKDTFNTNYLLNDWGDLTWDYTVEPDPSDYENGETDETYISDKAAWDATFTTQLSTAETFYNNRFIQDSEIRSFEYNDYGQLINPGIWDVLDNYKIPTLEFHHRNPIFLDFEYDINIVRYNITDSKTQIHQDIFDTIDGFFTGSNDSVRIEQFEVEYFNSSLDKRIDTILTDVTGFNSEVTTKLLLTQKNVSKENYLDGYRDIFIPLSIPFEDYFDSDGYLLYDKLPNIDTPNFVEYSGETGKDLYVDWSIIQNDIDNSITQSETEIITAHIRIKNNETVTLTDQQTEVEFTNIKIVPDDPTQLDKAEPLLTFNNVIVYKNNIELTYSTDWEMDPLYTDKITLLTEASEGDILTVNTNCACGMYHLYNTYKKYIIVQLYVNAIGYSDTSVSQYDYELPKSYLNTMDGFYDYTIDDYYLTTDGYVVLNDQQVNSITGVIFKNISPSSYITSSINMDLFRKNRYLNLNYSTPNFSVLKNIIPRLKRVSFIQGV